MARDQAVKRYAGGAFVAPTPEPTQENVPGPDDKAGETLYADQVNAEPDEPAAPQADVAAPEASDQAMPPAADLTPVAPAPQAPAPVAPAPQPKVAAAPPPPPPATPLTLAYDLDNETMKRMQDVQSGAIHPKTYADLVPKDTMGKMGTYFGLILSGMGSGLSGQPNAVLAMMDKTIDRDLEAQKTSKSNEMNLYKMNLEHVQTQTAGLRSQYENALADAQIKGVPSEIALRKSQIAHLDMDARILAQTHTKNDMMLMGLRSIAGGVTNMADGQQKQKAEIALNGVTQAGLGDIKERNAQTQSQIKFKSALNNIYDDDSKPDENQFQNTQNFYRMSGLDSIAEDRAKRHLHGVPGLSDTALSQQDTDRHDAAIDLVHTLQDLRAYATQHPTTLKWSAADAQGQSLATLAQLAFQKKELGGMFRPGDNSLMEKIVPSDPSTINKLSQVIPKIDALIDETKRRHQSYLRGKGFQVEAPKSLKSKGAAGAESDMGSGESLAKDAKGNVWVVKNGQTIRRYK